MQLHLEELLTQHTFIASPIRREGRRKEDTEVKEGNREEEGERCTS